MFGGCESVEAVAVVLLSFSREEVKILYITFLEKEGMCSEKVFREKRVIYSKLFLKGGLDI